MSSHVYAAAEAPAVTGGAAAPEPTRVHAVVVAYNSADTLADCVEPLAALDRVEVTVVDNASPDASLDAIAHLDVDTVRAADNRGFAAGCNLGIARSDAPYVLLVNPDARMTAADLDVLRGVLDSRPRAGLVAPRILESDGRTAWSQFRFPRRRSTYAQALFLHRLWPRAAWTDELVRDPAAYEVAGSPEWVSGACLLIRRAALDEIGPMDESYFMYCEDIDLCARLRAAGWELRFEPAAAVDHEGGVSHPRSGLLAVHARARVRLARKREGVPQALAEALGIALGHATHALANISRPAARRGHLKALRAAAREAVRRG